MTKALLALLLFVSSLAAMAMEPLQFHDASEEQRFRDLAAELRCATTGVFAPLTGIIGTLQAAEALKLLIGIKRGLSGKLLTINALEMNITRSNLSKDLACSACGGLLR